MRYRTIKKINKLKTTSRYKNSRQLNKTIKNDVIKINLDTEKAELLLLYMTMFNYTLLLIRLGHTKSQVKNKIMELLYKLQQNNRSFKNMSKCNLESLFERHYKIVYKVKKNIDSKLNNSKKLYSSRYRSKTKKHNKTTKTKELYKGGFYFKNLEEKADQPITGTDLSKFLDEMQQFFYNAQYTEEGAFLRNANTVISMLRGDLGQFKGIIQYQILPKYISYIPPFINFHNIKDDFIDKRKWEDIPDYLLAYQSYLRSRDEYLVDKGLKSPTVLSKDLYTGFYDKLAHSLDTNIYKMQDLRRKSQFQFPISIV
jgi:hypothetical protein